MYTLYMLQGSRKKSDRSKIACKTLGITRTAGSEKVIKILTRMSDFVLQVVGTDYTRSHNRNRFINC